MTATTALVAATVAALSTAVAVAAPPAAPPPPPAAPPPPPAATIAPPATSGPPLTTVPPVDLGGLPGLRYSSATAINDRGDVVGSGYSGSYDSHGFSWSHGVLTALPDTARAPFRINNAGQIAGTLPGRFYSPGFVRRPDGTVVALDFSTSDQNERGEVVGTGPVTDGGSHAKLWRDNHTFDLGAPAGHTSDARAISTNGWILGEVQNSSHTDDYFARWVRGRWVPLPTPSGYGSDINSRGDVVGWATNADGVTHAMLWQGDRPIDLDPSDPLSQAVAVNDAGQILGDTFDPVTNIGPHPALGPWPAVRSGHLRRPVRPPDRPQRTRRRHRRDQYRGLPARQRPDRPARRLRQPDGDQQPRPGGGLHPAPRRHQPRRPVELTGRTRQIPAPEPSRSVIRPRPDPWFDVVQIWDL
ncbi:hypothetical protein [Candidatus Frankia nodulisporulans]|uniref:hypothetical protein n=1 Tax=Candidatus Frankia nodulisporulans TaxID=2060052 RepID=UPI001C2EE3EB|nr:hypothetical protein [Candidatus Frankia nodulisporulans]